MMKKNFFDFFLKLLRERMMDIFPKPAGYGFLFCLSLVILIQNLTADDYLFTANRKYYNPFAISFNYRLRPSKMLEKQQNFKLDFWIRNRQTAKTLLRTTLTIDSVSDEYDIYFFLKYDKDNENMAMSIHIPDNSMSAGLGFLFPGFTSGDIGCQKKITGTFGKEYHLMTISPLHGKIMIGNLLHTNFFYKKALFQPLEAYIRITKTPAVSGSELPPRAGRTEPAKSPTDPAKEMKEVELRYLAGKASFQELSQARERLNEHLLKNSRSKSKSKAGNGKAAPSPDQGN